MRISFKKIKLKLKINLELSEIIMRNLNLICVLLLCPVACLVFSLSTNEYSTKKPRNHKNPNKNSKIQIDSNPSSKSTSKTIQVDDLIHEILLVQQNLTSFIYVINKEDNLN